MTNYFVRLITPGLIVFGFAFTAMAQPPAPVEPPTVPAHMQVPPGHSVFYYGRGTGWQHYSCVWTGGPGYRWIPLGPKATLFEDSKRGPRQVATHFRSPNPIPSPYYAIPQSWQHSADSSRVWVNTLPQSTSDPNYVEPGAIEWELARVEVYQPGPTGGSFLTPTTYILRANTSGGRADSTPGCESASNVGRQLMVPFTAEYFFYRADTR